MTRFASWLHWPRLLPLRQPPPLPVRVPPPPLDPPWGPVWVLEAARKIAAELGPDEQPRRLRMTTADGGAHFDIDIMPGESWPVRSLISADVPDNVAGAEREGDGWTG